MMTTRIKSKNEQFDNVNLLMEIVRLKLIISVKKNLQLL
ncbi:unnamed protein product [Paramecium pentaurelia]|uniref:Uncharacterized protein n=1 Tax=Paramecium pentaurelia TaxID=43138 RepID=A0A8S1XQF3_9CILI|nr:unnamed protein product [Paramecium pentaurelia]